MPLEDGMTKYLMIAMVAMAVISSGTAAGQTILSDNFECYPNDGFPGGGWHLRSDGYGSVYQKIDNLTSVSGSHSLKLESKCNWSAEAFHLLPSRPTAMRLEVMILLRPLENQRPPYQDAIVAFQNSRSPANSTYGIAFANGMVGNLPVAYNEWHNVRIDLNSATLTYSAWVDGKAVASDQSFAGGPLPDAVTLSAQNAPHMRVNFDDLTVTQIDQGYGAGSDTDSRTGDGLEMDLVFRFPNACNWSDLPRTIHLFTEADGEIATLRVPDARDDLREVRFDRVIVHIDEGLHIFRVETEPMNYPIKGHPQGCLVRARQGGRLEFLLDDRGFRERRDQLFHRIFSPVQGRQMTRPLDEKLSK
jgi:hypothetical protein